MKQIDLEEAIAAKKKALEKVADNSGDFVADALAAIRELPAGRYTGEDFRIALEERGVKPHHPNAWGALTSIAARRKIIEATTSMRAMRSKKSHARLTRVWLKL